MANLNDHVFGSGTTRTAEVCYEMEKKEWERCCSSGEHKAAEYHQKRMEAADNFLRRLLQIEQETPFNPIG